MVGVDRVLVVTRYMFQKDLNILKQKVLPDISFGVLWKLLVLLNGLKSLGKRFVSVLIIRLYQPSGILLRKIGFVLLMISMKTEQKMECKMSEINDGGEMDSPCQTTGVVGK